MNIDEIIIGIINKPCETCGKPTDSEVVTEDNTIHIKCVVCGEEKT